MNKGLSVNVIAPANAKEGDGLPVVAVSVRIKDSSSE